MKAYYDQNRELILASKQEANQKAKRDMYRPTVWVQYVQVLFTRKGPVYRVRVFLRAVVDVGMGL